MQLEWAAHVPGDVLILAPLAVAAQTVREGKKFGIVISRFNELISSQLLSGTKDCLLRHDCKEEVQGTEEVHSFQCDSSQILLSPDQGVGETYSS
jgi:hypothetical protein